MFFTKFRIKDHDYSEVELINYKYQIKELEIYKDMTNCKNVIIQLITKEDFMNLVNWISEINNADQKNIFVAYPKKSSKKFKKILGVSRNDFIDMRETLDTLYRPVALIPINDDFSCIRLMKADTKKR